DVVRWHERAERDVAHPHLVEPEGRQERCEQGDDDEQRHDAEPGEQHPPLQAVGGLDERDTGERPATGGLGPRRGPAGGLEQGGHQYLTRGSTRALIRSMMKLVTATTTAIAVTMPCTATKSRASRYCASVYPMPCHSKVVSVRIAPAR